jgi:16S rRNA (adenine1518-N6/adenine1519-N6)-dimethyltransferase
MSLTRDMENSAHIPRKRFGQNFLRDQRVIEKIVALIAPQAGQVLVEIGPGQGAMTIPLLRALGQMSAIELDRDLIGPLGTMAQGVGRLEIISADALTVDFTELAKKLGGKLRVVGNLPYNISTPLIFHLLEHVDAISDMHFMLQKEVVDRMACLPGSKVYGRLSVMAQAQAQISSMFKVPPTAFWPVPKVDSAIVRLQPLERQLPATELAALDTVVRLAFGARRKTLANGLITVLSALQIAAVGIDPKRRAETLSQGEFQSLARALISLA